MMLGQVAVVCLVLTCAQIFSNLPGRTWGSNGPQMDMVPRCPSATKPCRTKAVMQADFLPSGSLEIQSQLCSCQIADCSDDWSDQQRIITRKLLTNGNISMTFSMMFCTPIQPQSLCQSGQVALQLSGWTPMLTEVDYINCACRKHRNLVPHTVSTGSDHKQYHAYVCIDHKKRCKRRRGVLDTCMEQEPNSQTVRYPCRCEKGSTCQEESVPPYRYICQK